MSEQTLERGTRNVTERGEAVIEEVIRALRGIRFGSVEILVHDAKVVQIERKEKVRLDR